MTPRQLAGLSARELCLLGFYKLIIAGERESKWVDRGRVKRGRKEWGEGRERDGRKGNRE